MLGDSFKLKIKVVFLFIFGISFITLFFIHFSNYILDDFLIYSQYIKNITNGNGFVFNNDEKVNGVSSILFLGLSVTLNFIVGNPLLSQFLVSIIAVIGIFLVSYYYSNRTNLLYFYLFFGFTVVLFRYLYNLMGMETSLYLFLFLSLLFLIDLNEKKYLPLLFSLIVLTRVEGFFLLTAYLIVNFNFKKPFENVTIGIIPLIAWCGYLLFNFSYFGELLPQSGVAKILHGKSYITDHFPVSFTYLYLQYEWFLSFVSYILAFFILFAIIGLITYPNYKIKAIIILNLIITISFYVFNNIHNYSWYYSTTYFSIILLASWGFENTISKIKTIDIATIKYSSLAVISIITISIFIKLFTILPYKVRNDDFIEYKKIAVWMQNNSEKNARIACFEIGIIGFYSERYTIDIMGLVQKHNALSISKNNYTEWYSRYKPTYILVHSPAWTPYEDIVNSPYFSNFEEVKELNLPTLKLFKKTTID